MNLQLTPPGKIETPQKFSLDEITAVFLPNPFQPTSRKIEKFLPGEVATLQDLQEYFEINSETQMLWVLNGKQIETESLESIKLVAGDFVAVSPRILGGGGGKNLAGLVAAIAIMSFTGGTGAGLLGGLLSSKAGMLGLGLAMYLGGSLLTGNQKIPKIDTPDMSSSAMNGGFNWSPDEIKVVEGGPIPMTFGTVRTSGQLIGRRITTQEVNGEQVQFLYLLIACNDGELDSISNIKINDTDIASIDNAYYETKLGTNEQTAVTGIITSVAEQQAFSHELPNEVAGSSWITKTQTELGKQIELEFVYPAGIFGLSTSNGAMSAVNVFTRGQYREVGAGTWIDIFDTDGNPYKQIYLATRKPYYWKHAFTPPDTSKLYEFRFQNYSLTYYNGLFSWTEIPSNYAMNCTWLSLTVIDDVAETYPNTALVALGLPAADNLSGSMPKASWEQTRSNVLVWNSNLEVFQLKDATNIAWMVYGLIHDCRWLWNINTGSYEYVVLGEPAANLDYTSFDSWATFCGTVSDGVARAVGNLLVDSPEQLWPTVQKIAASGRGFIIQSASIFKPVWDCSTTMSQIFTSGNKFNGSEKGGFLPETDRATAIEASFINEDNGYVKDTMFVPGDDYSPANLSNPTQVFFPGLTDPDIVFRAARHMLRKNKYLKRTISFQADIDSIVAQIGDVVGVQSDILGIGVEARILGATTTQLVINQDVTMQAGTTYSILIRDSATDTLYRKTVDAVAEETTTNTIYFTGDPFTTPPDRYALAAFGVLNLEVKPYQITNVTRNSDLQATIEAIEYVEGIYIDDSDFPVINYTTSNAGVNSLTVKADDDTGKLGISWSIPTNTDYTGSIVFIDDKPQGFFTAEVSTFEVDTTPGSHTVTIIPVGPNGHGTPKTDTVTLGSATLADVSGISLDSDLVQQSDGTALVYITGTFTVPTLASSILVEIGETATPSTWSTLQDARVADIYYGPVKPGTTYTLRFTARNKYAVSDAVTDQVTTAGDTTAPGTPTIVATSHFKNVSLAVSLGSPPDDMAGFKIYKNTVNNSATADYLTSVEAKDGNGTTSDIAETYGQVLYYWAKSYDRWGNLSGFSSVSFTNPSSVDTSDIAEAAIEALQIAQDAVTEAKIATDAITTAKIDSEALKNPLGSILRLSATGSDATSIALADGVKDVSGNGNHGRAYGGVAIVDTDVGKAFSFDGIDDYANMGLIDFLSSVGTGEISVSFWISRSSSDSLMFALDNKIAGTFSPGFNFYTQHATGIIFRIGNGSETTQVISTGISTSDGDMHHVVGVRDSSGLKLYIDGVINNTEPTGGSWDISSSSDLFLAAFNTSAGYAICAKMADIRLYSKALSTAEVKSLYMLPQDAVFGRITADLIGANQINANHLTTGELITASAQIKDSIITNAKISALDAGKINTGTLAAARIAVGSLTADKITGGALVVGSAAGDINAGATSISGGKITTNTIAADVLMADSVSTSNLQTGAVTADEIGANAVTAAKILAGSITAEKIDVTALKMPADAVANWTARGATSSTISKTDGVKDISGNGNHGTAFQGTTIADTEVGKAFSFDGTNDYINLGVLPELSSIGTGELSVSFWLSKSSSTAYQSMLDNKIAGTGYAGFNFFSQSASNILFRICNGTSTAQITTTGVNFSDGDMHHVVAVRDSSGLKVYVDGILNISGTTGGAWNISSPYNLYFGSYTNTAGFLAGKMTGPAIFTRALTAAEIKTLYMIGSDSESGTITADRVVTGELKSLNYSTTVGSMFDLDAGDLTLGGSSDPEFSFSTSTGTGKIAGLTFTNGTLSVSDVIATATTESFSISNASGAGVLTSSFSFDATPDTSDFTRVLEMRSGKIEIVLNHYYSANDVTTEIGYGWGTDASEAPIIVTLGSSSYYGFSTNGRGYASDGWLSSSDETVKSDIQEISVLETLKNTELVPVKKYRFDDKKLKAKAREKAIEKSLRDGNKIEIPEPEPELLDDYNPTYKVGAMAAQFNKAFGVNQESTETVCLNDQIGVALRAIQELAAIVDQQAARIEILEAEKNGKK